MCTTFFWKTWCEDILCKVGAVFGDVLFGCSRWGSFNACMTIQINLESSRCLHEMWILEHTKNCVVLSSMNFSTDPHRPTVVRYFIIPVLYILTIFRIGYVYILIPSHLESFKILGALCRLMSFTYVWIGATENFNVYTCLVKMHYNHIQHEAW